jgi:hypothetical protein
LDDFFFFSIHSGDFFLCWSLFINLHGQWALELKEEFPTLLASTSKGHTWQSLC